MNQLIQKINVFMSSYINNKNIYKTASRDNPSMQLLVDEIPNIIKNMSYISDSYKIKGSIGVGNVSEIPWVCIFDAEITNKATEGYYIVLAFKSDMQGYYLSLNQGWTQYKNKYGTTEGKKRIIENSAKATKILRSCTNELITGPIDLKAEKALGKGYQLANICSFYYDINSRITDNKFINDIHNLIGIYRELKGLVGTDILDIFTNSSEEDYQEEIQRAISNIASTTEPIKVAKSDLINSTSKKFKRDPSIAKAALERENFKCIFDSNHTTFTTAATMKQYMEAHHIVPMEFQNDFKYKLDIQENIVSICPNCHTKIHRSIFNEKKSMISFLYKKRIHMLKKKGINFTIDKLEEYYR